MIDVLSRRDVVAPILAVTLAAACTTMSYPLLTLLMERASESGAAIGLNTALASLGILAAGPVLARSLAVHGAPRVMLACAAAMALCVLGFAATYDFVLWCVLRFLLGVASGGIYLATEYWVVAKAPPERRGRVVSAYAFTLALGYAAGPSFLRLTGIDGAAPFLVAAALAAAAAAPLALGWRGAPVAAPDAPRGPSPYRFAITDPSLIFAVILFGAIEFGAHGLIPVWGIASGYDADQTVVFAIVLALGGPVFLPLIGWAADRFAARAMLLVCAGVSVAVAVALPLVSQIEAAVWALFFLWGGTAIGLYTVSLTAMGARYDGPALAGGNAALVMAYGVGATAGPPMVGAALDWAGAVGLPLAFGLAAGLFAVFAAFRGLRRGVGSV